MGARTLNTNLWLAAHDTHTHFDTPSPMDGRGALLGPEKCVMASAATTYLLHMMEDINIEVSEAFIELHHHAKRVVGSILPERLER